MFKFRKQLPSLVRKRVRANMLNATFGGLFEAIMLRISQQIEISNFK